MNKEYIEKANKYKQLSAEERRKIEACCAFGCSISEIACLIKRSKSTSCKEIKREI